MLSRAERALVQVRALLYQEPPDHAAARRRITRYFADRLRAVTARHTPELRKRRKGD